MTPPSDRFTGLRILVVEDELLVAMEIEGILENIQCEIVGPVSTVESAIAAIKQDDHIDGVFLDLNLAGASSLPIAEELRGKGVPFILVTGYASLPSDPPALREARRLNKPFNQHTLTDAMAEVF